MRFLLLLVWCTGLFGTSNIHGQKLYSSNQIQLIFSNAPNATRGEQHIASPVRFSAFFNYSTVLNLDLNRFLGLSAGIEVKNIGMILRDSIFRTKHRAYAVGIPVYLRVGNMDKRWYAMLGAQYDYLFAYKEKVFFNDSKLKRHGYNKVNPFIPSVFVGFRFSSGTSFSVHYMLQDFLSRDYRFQDPTQNNERFTQGYTNTQLIYFSIGFMGDLDRRMSKSKKKTPPAQGQEVYSRTP